MLYATAERASYRRRVLDSIEQCLHRDSVTKKFPDYLKVNLNINRCKSLTEDCCVSRQAYSFLCMTDYGSSAHRSHRGRCMAMLICTVYACMHAYAATHKGENFYDCYNYEVAVYCCERAGPRRQGIGGRPAKIVWLACCSWPALLT